ncbi:MAG: hypothetical protein L0027_09585 [Candidatus Rokubacteria bacterium]|nr:hypothetical protein [Candidatus Rokubacteria bacterium]
MAGTKRPSFLKKLKEQKRRARADEKRLARQARREAKASGVIADETPEELSVEGDAVASEPSDETPEP